MSYYLKVKAVIAIVHFSRLIYDMTVRSRSFARNKFYYCIALYRQIFIHSLIHFIHRTQVT